MVIDDGANKVGETEKPTAQKISFIGVVEKTRRYFLCSLPPNAINKLEGVFTRYNCKIKDKIFSVVVFQGGRGKYKELQGKIFFLLQPYLFRELKLKLGKIKVELWKS